VQVQNLRRHLFGGFTPYFEPIVGPEFIIESRIVKQRGRTIYVETQLFDPPETLAVIAPTTLREIEGPSPES
jgi:hypothetical protein